MSATRGDVLSERGLVLGELPDEKHEPSVGESMIAGKGRGWRRPARHTDTRSGGGGYGRRVRWSKIRPLVVRLVIGLLALGVAWLVFASPITHVWYESRQHALANQAAGAGSTIGSAKPQLGQQVGILQDPSVGLNVVVAQGTTVGILRGGPGHRLGTPLPGAKGNSVIYGHRKDWGAPFSRLATLLPGDKLYLQARQGVAKLSLGQTGYFIYTVVAVKEEPANDTKVLAPTSDYRLTLITNAGGRLSGNDDLVVTAVSGTAAPTRTVHHSTGHRDTSATEGSIEPIVGSVLFNGSVVSFLLRAAAAGLVVMALRRRHRTSVAVIAATPLILAALLSLFLEVDVALFRPLS